MEADPDVRRYVGGGPRSRKDAERKFRDTHLGHASDQLALRATIFKSTSLYIGYCGLYPSFGPKGAKPGEAALAIYLAREYWGHGLATEAGRAFIKFGFTQLHLTRIVATVQVGNVASCHIMEKLGFAMKRTERGVRSFHHFELVNLF
jgi:RimJ/RimL family protein N-acetyltransferase